MQDCCVMLDEAMAQWGAAQADDTPPTHPLIQGGVGGVAAAVSVQARTVFPPAPMLVVVATMRLLAQAGVVAGESGVAGLAGCLPAAADPVAREVLGLRQGSRVLAFSTEGAMDPELYAWLVGSPCDAIPA